MPVSEVHMLFKDYKKNIEFESIDIGFKEIISHKNYEKWAKTFAAFANTEGGLIYFGITDDEEMVGIEKEQLKKDILYINHICDSKISPRIKYAFNKIKVNEDKFVLEATVKRNDKLPVWLRREDEEDVIYIRRDGESVIARGDEIEELVFQSKRPVFDEIKTEIKYKDVTFNKLNEVYMKRNQTNEKLDLKVLQRKNLITLDGYLTNTGLLFMDNTPFKNSNIACRLWPSLSKGSAKMLDYKTYQGDILTLLEYAKNYIMMFTKQGLVKLPGGGRLDVVSYPERAIEEALVNAFAHRDYYIDGTQIDIDIFQDRIQISSPGKFLLPGNAQDYSMRLIPSARRNENICGVLVMCKLMETSGSGFDNIADAYDAFEKKYQPKIYSDPAQFIITLMDLTYNQNDFNESENVDYALEFKSPRSGAREYDEMILKYCFEEPKSRIEIQNYIHITNRSYFVISVLNPLLDSELLLTTQEAKNAPNQKYYTNKDRVRIV